MRSKASECGVCYREFDRGDCSPLIISECGHTVCKFCLSILLREVLPECPFDRKKLNRKSLSSYKVNYSLQNLLEEIAGWERCQSCGDEIEFVCLTDKCKVCRSCWHYTKHRKHEIKSLAEIAKALEHNKARTKELLLDLDEYSDQTKREIEERMTQLEQKIGSWNGIPKSLKLGMLFELRIFIIAEKREAENRYFERLKKEVNKRTNDLNEFYNSRNSIELLEESKLKLFGKMEREVKEKVYLMELQNRVFGFSRVLYSMLLKVDYKQEERDEDEANIQRIREIWSDRCEVSKGITENHKYDLIFEKSGMYQTKNDLHIFPMYDLQGQFEDVFQLKEAENIRTLHLWYNGEDKINTFAPVKWAVERLGNLENLAIFVSDYQHSFDHMLPELFSILFSHLRYVKRISVFLNSETAENSDCFIDLFSEKVISELLNPLEIKLSLGETDFSQESLNRFLGKVNQVMQENSRLRLVLNEAKITTETIKEIYTAPYQVSLSNFEKWDQPSLKHFLIKPTESDSEILESLSYGSEEEDEEEEEEGENPFRNLQRFYRTSNNQRDPQQRTLLRGYSHYSNNLVDDGDDSDSYRGQYDYRDDYRDDYGGDDYYDVL